MIYLRILNEWTNTSVQGEAATPIGRNLMEYGENERYKMFINDTGLVPTHMPWIILGCIDWMERHPCQSNDVHLVDDDRFDPTNGEADREDMHLDDPNAPTDTTAFTTAT
eukprot:2620697-Amphidinium_carterae.1